MTKKSKPRKIYANAKQIEFLQAKQKTKTAVWGRGSGKSSLVGLRTTQRLEKLPRAKGFLSSTTYNQIETKTLPAIEGIWMEMGLMEYDPESGFGHYVIGRRPPRWFTKPYQPPRKYEHIITFWNGLTIEMLSLDRPDLGRGGSYDFGDVDEAALLKEDTVNRILLPSIRGNIFRFSDPMHQELCFYSSMPWKSDGYWLLEYEDKAKAMPDDYFYSEATAFDNIVILTEEGLRRLEMSMTYHEYQVEVLNQRIVKLPDGFYYKFDDVHHAYVPKYKYTTGERGLYTVGTKEYNPKALLDIPMDFGGWFNCAAILQEKDNVERCINSFWVKEDEKVNELVDNICRHYNAHEFKLARVWGEPRGHDKNAMGDTIFEQVRRRFEHNGWECEIMAPSGYSRTHEQRFYFINDILGEEIPGLPVFRINQDACKDVILAIQSTQVTSNFKKDKKKEKDRKFPQQHAPHFTDALDYYFMQKHFYKVAEETAGGGGWFETR